MFSRPEDRPDTFASYQSRDFSTTGPNQSTQVVYDSTSWNTEPPPLGFDDQAPSSIEGSGYRQFVPTLGSVHYDPATASGGPDWQMRPLTSTAVRAPRHFSREEFRGGRIQDPPRPEGEGGSKIPPIAVLLFRMGWRVIRLPHLGVDRAGRIEIMLRLTTRAIQY